jgi:hypothetical protein
MVKQVKQQMVGIGLGQAQPKAMRIAPVPRRSRVIGKTTPIAPIDFLAGNGIAREVNPYDNHHVSRQRRQPKASKPRGLHGKLRFNLPQTKHGSQTNR